MTEKTTNPNYGRRATDQVEKPKEPGWMRRRLAKAKHHPIPVMIRTIREIGNQVAIIKIKWLLAGMLIFGVSVVLTQFQFNGVNERERDKIMLQRDRDKYLADLTTFRAVVNARDLCLDGVTRSDYNREQWLNLASIVDELPDKNAHTYAELIRHGPLLSQLPRSVDDCPQLPPVPVAPAALQGDTTTTTEGES